MGYLGPNSFDPDTAVSPNLIVAPPGGHRCIKHPKKDAYKIVIGESDSMGSETHEMCRNCYGRYLWALQNRTEDELPHCEKCDSTDGVRGRRDPDEGSCGPVYYWCRACTRSFNEEWNKNNPPEEEESYYQEPRYLDEDLGDGPDHDYLEDPDDQ